MATHLELKEIKREAQGSEQDTSVMWSASETGIQEGDLRKNSEGRVYQAETAGTSGPNEPTGPNPRQSDGTIVWIYLSYPDAVRLLRKTQTALDIIANTLSTGGKINGGAYPADGNEAQKNEAMAFAQRVVTAGNGVSVGALGQILAANKEATVATILGAPDETIDANLEQVVPGLARGLKLGG